MSKLPCEPDQWPTFSRLLYAALDLPLDERAAWLDSLATELAYFRPGLAKVLECAELPDAAQFLNRPVIAVVEDSEFAPAQRIGPYTLERELGRGGMSEVWLATRSDGTLTRQVALKLPYAHLLAGPQRQRFGRERDILAALSHPHVAVLYDAGVSDDGHPYLAMEWIDGIPITRYCEEMQLSIRARLTLFRQVLEAVHYAHTNLVAHRDLKPSNILVTRRGEVKLLDFGIAKLLGRGTDGSATEVTRLGGRAATPDYAAPEQIRGEPITTAVDIYALGVLLFEVLTGVRPFDAPRSGAEDRGPFPLASRRAGGESARAVGGLSAAQLRKALHGDLDAVIAKALERDPTNRYRSAEAFADDLTHYLCHEPVSARRIGRLLQLTKFVQRNRAASALAATLLLALIGGSAGIAWEALRAEREAARAETEKRSAESEARREKATKDFLVSVFKASDPRIAADKPRGTITAKELLDISSERIQKEFARDPQTAIELLGTLGDIYIVLDETEHALQLIRQQTELARAHDGPLSTTLINGLLLQADAESSMSRYAEASRALDEADASIRQAGLDRSSYRAFWWYERAAVLVADPASRQQRTAALESSVALFAAVAPRDLIYPHALSDLGGVYFSRNDFTRAREYLKRAIDIDESGVDPDEAHLASMYSNLGKALMSAGELDGSADAFQRAGNMALKAYGVDSRFYWTAIAHRARALDLLGERERAQAMFSEVMPLLPAKSYRNAEEEQTAARVNEVYASSLLAEGRAAAAIPVFQVALAEFAEAKQDSSSELRVRALLAQAYARTDHAKEARRGLYEVLNTLSETLKPDNPRVLNARQAWGAFLLDQGEVDEAARQFDEVLNRSSNSTTSIVALSLGGRAQIAIARHQVAAALTSSLQAVDTFDRVTGFRDVRVGSGVWRIRAEALLLSGDANAALVWAQRALDADRRYDDPASPDIAAAETTVKKIRYSLTSVR
jgi:serine/threonine protein kinase/Tfp pilus assembly protein PilF